MKTIGLGLLLLFIMGFSQAAFAQANTPEKVTKDFYIWYLKAYYADDFPLTSKPAKLKQFISSRFYKEAKRDYDKGEFDADPFIMGQDADTGWVNNINILKATKTKSSASVTVFFKGSTKSWNHKLKVDLILEKASWKIDKITDLDN